MNVCVFCSANDLSPAYTDPAKELAGLLAKAGHTYVWGGSDHGLMGEMASAAQDAGGRIWGVSVEFLKEKVRKNADEMIIAKDLGERKALLLSLADVLVLMVGGIGTLDEVTEILEHKKHGHHNKPVVALNTERFYDGLQLQLKQMEQDGFLTMPLEELVHFADSPQAVMEYIGKFVKPAGAAGAGELI